MIRLYSLTAGLLLLVCGLSAQDFISKELKGSRSRALLTSQFGNFIQNGIVMYKVTYTTPDVFGQLDTASGLLLVPLREEATRYPLLVYQHGTVDGPQDVPSNLRGGYELATVFAGMGYVTLAPDYLGAGESRGFHPYVHAASEASAALDMLRATRSHAPEMDLLLNEQLFVTGYSQGGHASMALHKAIEENFGEEFTVTAASHMSGPYSISGVMRELILSDEAYFTPAYLPNTYLSYNYVYGFYDSTVQIFKPQYVDGIDAFFNGELGLFALNAQLIAQLTAETGASVTRNMLQDSIVTILSNPDDDHPLLNALRDNDVYEWAPQQPTRIFYCTADDQVPYRNSIVADSVMNALGAPAVVAVDVNSSADHGGCVEPAVINTILFFANFAQWVVNTEVAHLPLAVQLGPNPVQDRLYIRGLTVATHYRLFTTDGRLVQEGQLNIGSPELDLSTLTAGLYIIHLQNSEGKLIRQLVVN
ncbi:MAG: T9SS C-terminal target domain-containing protein [Bacteroidetes bacterium]|nr:MAG: T9SS C-terminal target domain-containing protein [Bacteroidota bacterium]